ncbi:hypothetical protein [Anaerostipes sp. MSJ-23]|nr:hypothetical protein [Anaerostipes sp. MSJ-23]MBU5459414.1 hypothetical protein [Anaerostipes sp. MSJ-23]
MNRKKYFIFLLCTPLFLWGIKRFIFLLRKKRARILVTQWKNRYQPFS